MLESTSGAFLCGESQAVRAVLWHSYVSSGFSTVRKVLIVRPLVLTTNCSKYVRE